MKKGFISIVLFFIISQMHSQNDIHLKLLHCSKLILTHQNRFNVKIKFTNTSDSISYILYNANRLQKGNDTVTDCNVHAVYLTYNVIDKNDSLLKSEEGFHCFGRYWKRRLTNTEKKEIELIKKLRTDSLYEPWRYGPIVLKPKQSIKRKYTARFSSRDLITVGWYKLSVHFASGYLFIDRNGGKFEEDEKKYNAKVFFGNTETKFKKFLYLSSVR